MKLLILIGLAVCLMGAAPSGCTTNLLKAGGVLNALSEVGYAISREPTLEEIRAEERAWATLKAENTRAAMEWAHRSRIPAPPGWYDAPPPTEE